MSFSSARYQQIEKLVIEYQNHNPDAALELIELFNPLFNKYVKIIKTGAVDLSDYDSRFFISMFIIDPRLRSGVRNNYYLAKNRDAAYRVADFICNGCCSLSEEDLMQDFSIILLKLASGYKLKDRSFVSYTGTTFKYEVSQLIRKILGNPLTSAIPINLDNEETLDTRYIHKNDIIVDDIFPSNEIDELDNNWVYGITCNEVFCELDNFERLILKMSYVDNMSDIEISEKTGYHRNWIGIRRRTAIEKLRQKIYG
jgi:RNA polymerase sigma factor (sigma-70 family)